MYVQYIYSLYHFQIFFVRKTTLFDTLPFIVTTFFFMMTVVIDNFALNSSIRCRLTLYLRMDKPKCPFILGGHCHILSIGIAIKILRENAI